MKLGLDVSSCYHPRSGVGNYCYQLTKVLLNNDVNNQYVLYPLFYTHFMNKVGMPVFEKTANSITAFRNRQRIYSLQNLLWSPLSPAFVKENQLGDVDVVHSMTFAAPKFRDSKKKLVATIYDLTFITHPQCHQKRNIQVCLQGTKNAIKNADAIIAISNHTKDDLMEYLNAPEELITVTHLAAGDDYVPIDNVSELARIKHKYHLPDKYILFIGSLEPRKNIKTLVEAFARLPLRLRDEFPLVIAGGKGWMNRDIQKVVLQLGLGPKIFFAGFIDSADISAVYSGATVFAYPSLYEGFGLPILESMSCGTPVISSNTSSMPEVAGDAALLVDPTNVEELSSGLQLLLENESLRCEMINKGLARATLFSWEKCAQETLNVYHQVL